ncbi:MAG: hypothetical protein NTZ48_05640 [Candidatus Omnitrophica bacterium]|nr:hypothetical protein [Candidatus Omnitrophota bacterium]
MDISIVITKDKKAYISFTHNHNPSVNTLWAFLKIYIPGSMKYISSIEFAEHNMTKFTDDNQGMYYEDTGIISWRSHDGTNTQTWTAAADMLQPLEKISEDNPDVILSAVKRAIDSFDGVYFKLIEDQKPT